jgi:hypothetical protein
LDNHAAPIILTSSNIVQGMIRIGSTDGGTTKSRARHQEQASIWCLLYPRQSTISGCPLEKPKTMGRPDSVVAPVGTGVAEVAMKKIGANGGGLLLLFGVETG